jgi:hypothetical protein
MTEEIIIRIKPQPTWPPIRGLSPDPEEFARELEKLIYDYRDTLQNHGWLYYLSHCVTMLRTLLASGRIAVLPPAEIVAQHMRMSEGAVRDTYRGIYAVISAGGKLPALAELEARSVVAQGEDAAPRRRTALPAPAAAAPAADAPPMRRRPAAAPPAPAKGFFG